MQRNVTYNCTVPSAVFSLLNVFGVSLSDRYQRKATFFRENSSISKGTLSDFTVSDDAQNFLDDESDESGYSLDR